MVNHNLSIDIVFLTFGGIPYFQTHISHHFPLNLPWNWGRNRPQKGVFRRPMLWPMQRLWKSGSKRLLMGFSLENKRFWSGSVGNKMMKHHFLLGLKWCHIFGHHGLSQGSKESPGLIDSKVTHVHQMGKWVGYFSIWGDAKAIGFLYSKNYDNIWMILALAV